MIRMPNEVRPRRGEQLLVRLTAPELDVLTAIAHLEGVTPNAYAYDLLRTHLLALAGDPFVRADLANRAAYRRGTASTTTLPRRRPPAGDASVPDLERPSAPG